MIATCAEGSKVDDPNPVFERTDYLAFMSDRRGVCIGIGVVPLDNDQIKFVTIQEAGRRGMHLETTPLTGMEMPYRIGEVEMYDKRVFAPIIKGRDWKMERVAGLDSLLE